MNDMDLLREYAQSHSEEAFAEVVRRYINLVYSAALRQTLDPDIAQDIVQCVFILLAHKAGSLSKNTILSGWLIKTARYEASYRLRTRIRRTQREQEAYMQSTLNEPDPSAWEKISPWLDAAMADLSETDRNAVALRFFENKTASEIAKVLKMNEEAAQKRVSRALEKMRKFFMRRGVALSTVAIGAALSANSIQAAPVALASSVTAIAISKGAVGTGSMLTLAKGVIKTMAWTNTKKAVVGGLIAVLAAGTVSTAVFTLTGRQAKNITVMQYMTNDISMDGKVRFRMLHDDVNRTGKTISKDGFHNSSFVHLDSIEDLDGKPIQFTVEQQGDTFQYSLTLNKPVKPNQKITYFSEGTMDGMVRPTGEPGVYRYNMSHWPNNGVNTHRVDVHMLPAGVTLREKTSNLEATTNENGQIVLKSDTIITNGGHVAFSYAYQVPPDQIKPIVVTNLNTVLQYMTNDISADGLVHFQMLNDNFNRSGRPMTTDGFRNSDFVHLEKMWDMKGKPIQFSQQHQGNTFRYSLRLNEPVQPGQKVTYISEGTIQNLIKPTGEPGAFRYAMNHWPGGNSDTHRIEVHRLPPGASLLKRSSMFSVATNDNGRIELKVDTIIGNGGHLELSYEYQVK